MRKIGEIGIEEMRVGEIGIEETGIGEMRLWNMRI
jgi:hypothetical protein